MSTRFMIRSPSRGSEPLASTTRRVSPAGFDIPRTKSLDRTVLSLSRRPDGRARGALVLAGKPTPRAASVRLGRFQNPGAGGDNGRPPGKGARAGRGRASESRGPGVE